MLQFPRTLVSLFQSSASDLYLPSPGERGSNMIWKKTWQCSPEKSWRWIEDYVSFWCASFCSFGRNVSLKWVQSDLWWLGQSKSYKGGHLGHIGWHHLQSRNVGYLRMITWKASKELAKHMRVKSRKHITYYGTRCEHHTSVKPPYTPLYLVSKSQHSKDLDTFIDDPISHKLRAKVGCR